MKRILLGLIGGVIVLLALAGALLTGWAFSVFGTDGRYEVPVAQVDVGGAALYVNLFNVQTDTPVPDGLLETYVVARSDDGAPLFLGVGEQEAVQDFLLGVPYEAASELAGGTFTTRPVPGLKVPAPDPVDAGFWAVSAVGEQPRLVWTEQNGAGVLVLMNADGSAGVQASLTATLESPRLVQVMVAVAVVSVLLGILGAVLLARALRSDDGARHR